MAFLKTCVRFEIGDFDHYLLTFVLLWYLFNKGKAESLLDWNLSVERDFMEELLLALTEIKAIKLVTRQCVDSRLNVEQLYAAIDKVNQRAINTESSIERYLLASRESSNDSIVCLSLSDKASNFS